LLLSLDGGKRQCGRRPPLVVPVKEGLFWQLSALNQEIVGSSAMQLNAWAMVALDALHVPHEPPVYSNPIVIYVGMSPPVRRHRTPHRHHSA